MIKLYKSKYSVITVLICLTFCVMGCQGTKNVPYFKDVSLAPQSEINTSSKFTEPVIQTDDILAISIFTIDPSTNMIVNQVGSQAVSSILTGTGGLGATPPTSGFLVDKAGEIDLSLIGKVKVSGLTTSKAKDLLKEKASFVYQNPNVQVRFANFKITVLGEVSRPASYLVPNEKVTVLDALGLAGDLTIYGKRENVILIRDNDGKKEFARLNLNSSDLFNSPFFYLKQNDVLYVEPTKGKAASLNQYRTQTFALIGTVLSVFIVLISRI
jgi:polysaccharide export outer membrane protein